VKRCSQPELNRLFIARLGDGAVAEVLDTTRIRDDQPDRTGIPDKLAVAIRGHKTRRVFARYNNVIDKDLAQAGDVLAQELALQPAENGCGEHLVEPPDSCNSPGP